MEKYTGLEIAVIGLAGKFPEAENIDQYWANLTGGKDCISEFSIDDVLAEGESESIAHDLLYVRSHAYVKSKEYFDAAFFGYRPDEAQLMDPQIRMFHECCWEALEDSGYSSTDNQNKIGLFAAGSSNLNWALHSYCENRKGLMDDFAAHHLREVSFLSSSISYKLNLKGPSIFLQTACSSSLVAIHEACNSILLGECNMALAGGVALKNYSKRGYIYKEGMILSRDGRCRPFDINSDGTVGGEGAGVVVLKRLRNAIEDRDYIYAIVKGMGINNDGNDKVGYTAPSVKGQVEAIRKAHKMAGVPPTSISYVETHGTATSLGDPIEIEALNEAFGGSASKYCAIGSVKSNIGHLDAAAGAAGFIKTVLALKHKKIPGSLHFKEANPKINFVDSPFYVNNTLKDWESSGPLRAGVSSFGIGGTNAHIVLEESPVMEYSTESRDYQLIVLSAKTKSSLARNTDQFIDYLKKSDGVDLSDITYTLQKGRVRFPYRKMLVCGSKEEAIDLLSSNQAIERQSIGLQEDLQNVIFMFSGQGFQYVNMCRDLYLSEKVFRDKVDECLRIAKPYSGENYHSILFSEQENHSDTHSINNTKYTQPLLFIIEYSLSHLLMHWGINPHYMIGHSIGEYVAACVSGVFTLEDCLRVVVRRGELMSQIEKGSMLSISVGEEALRPLLAGYSHIDLAVVNSATSLVVSGTEVDIEKFKKRVKKEGYQCKRLHTSHAFHSYMMEGVLEQFEYELSSVKISEPQIPYISNLTGELVKYEEIKRPSYWSDHLRHTVQFFQGAERLLSQGNAIFIEVGPGRGLCNYVSESKLFSKGHHVLSTVRQAQQKVNDAYYLAERLGYFWLNGIKIDWERYYQEEKRSRVSLPTYSFEKTFYTANVDARKLITAHVKEGMPAIERGHEAGLYECNWQHTLLPNEAMELSAGRLNFLVVSGQSSFSEFLIKRLILSGQKVIELKPGKSFKELKEGVLEVDLSAPEDLGQYLEQLGIPINNIIYCASLSEQLGSISYEALDEKLEAGYLGLSYLAKCIASLKQAEKINLTVFDNYLASVLGGDEVDPIKATIHGPARIIPSEILNVSSKVIDIPYPFQKDNEIEEYLPKLINEIFYESNDAFVAYRYKARWVRAFATLSWNEKLKSGVEIVRNGTYIITGGFGGMGFSIAGDLAHRQVGSIIIVSRSAFPPRGSWDEWLSSKGDQDPISQKIEQILKMENKGCEVELCRVDVSDESEVAEFLQGIRNKYSKVDGLIWAAGEVDYGGIIEKRKRGDFIKYISSKVHGLLLFEKYLDLKRLDFVALFSSIGNVFYQGKFGQVGYNASNEFLESYGYYLQKALGIHAFSINWCDWLDVGMTVNTIKGRLRTDNIRLINSEIPDGIYPKEGAAIFDKCLQSKEAVTTIYKGDLSAKIKSYRSGFKEIREALTALAEPTYPVGSNDIEGELVGVFSEFFGRDDIRGQDDFFELGGDSLKGMTLVARINQKIGANLSIRDLYRYSTIKQITEELLHRDTNAAVRSIPKAPIKKHYVLSSAQKRMYFLQMLDKESTAYNEVQTLWIEGDLDKQKLEATFQKLVNRHESLRTSFIYEDKAPKQAIVTDVTFKIEYFEYDENRLNEAIKSFVRPHHLDRTPLYRVGIIEKTPQEHLLMVDSHHIITDVLSQNIIVRDFTALYHGEALPELRLQYKDYAEWQQSEEQQKKMAAQKEFWINEFSETPEVLKLPADFPRPITSTHAGDYLDFALSIDHTAKLMAIAKEEEASMFMIMLSLYSIMLSKLSNQEDIVIGTSTAGRQHADLENMTGMFVNTLPLRSYPKGSVTFREFLSDLKSRTLACFDNQNYQYEELINELNLERDMAHNPLFDVMFVFQNFDVEEIQIPGLTFKPFNKEYTVSRFDITLTTFEKEKQIFFKIEYATDLFKKASIERFIASFQKITSTIVNDIDVKISDIEVIPDQERHQLLYDFNNTKVGYPRDETVISLFEKQVEKTPGHVALQWGSKTLSYEGLKERSDKIASYLQEKVGVEAGDLVGVMLGCEEYFIPLVLGILKAGGAYVPIDPTYPSERINAIIEDSQLEVLVTREKYHDESLRKTIKVVDLDQASETITAQQTSPFSAQVSSSALAYVIYTSGSTGKPKGVMIEHRSLVNYIRWAAEYYVKHEEAAFALFTSIAFDLTVTSVFTPLITGNKIVMYEEDNHALLVEKVFSDNEATIVKLTPSHLKIVRDSKSAVFSSGSKLKTLIVGGEELRTELADAIYNKFEGRVEICNEYGPTEATVGCMIHKMEAGSTLISVPLGIPVNNTQIYLLDSFLKPVPLGAVGELYISGDGLARGYLNNESLSKESFIANPFVEGERMYKTGDLAVRHFDGVVLFKGRVDDQVKLRGFRIELGEIVSHLASHIQVKEAVVVVKENEEDQYLVAYYVSEKEIEASELRSFLGDRLPEYMIPSYYVRLERMPLTSNGKLDRKSLPDPAISANDYIAPSNEVEEKLVEIWSEVLKIDRDRISVNSNFFELGGNSIRAIRLIRDIYRKFSVRVELNQMFDNTSIKKLSIVIDSARIEGHTALPKVGEKEYYPASPAQERLFYRQMLYKDDLTNNTSIALEIKEGVDIDKLKQSFQLLINRHESLRTSFTLRENGLIQRINQNVTFELEILDQSKYRTVQEAFNEFVRPFDLSMKSLMRYGLLKYNGQRLLFIDFHHIICDGTSLNILIKDLRDIYQGKTMTPLDVRYVDYASWLNNLEDMEKQKAYWAKKLSGELPRMDLPVNRDRALADIHPASMKVLKINGETYQNIKKFLAVHNVSDFVFLLSIYYIVLSKTTGNSDVIIGTDVVGRSQMVLKDVVGTFVNILPLRLQVRSEYPYEKFLSDVKVCVLEAFDNQDFQFDQMVSLIAERKNILRNPIFDFHFAFLNAFDSDDEMSELEFALVEIEKLGTTQYEFQLEAWERNKTLNIAFIYNSTLYDDETIVMLMHYYNNVLTTVLKNSTIDIDNIELENTLEVV